GPELEPAGGAPAQSCVAGSPVNWNGCTSVVTGPSNTVPVGPSTRRLTVTGAAIADPAEAAMRPAAKPGDSLSFMLGAPLSTRAFGGCGRREVSWLPGLRAAPSRADAQWPAAASVPGDSGGTAPESHRLPCPPTFERWPMVYDEVTMTVNL